MGAKVLVIGEGCLGMLRVSPVSGVLGPVPYVSSENVDISNELLN